MNHQSQATYSFENYLAQEDYSLDYPLLFPQIFDQSFYDQSLCDFISSMEFLQPPLLPLPLSSLPPPPSVPLLPAPQPPKFLLSLENDVTFSSDGATVMTETQVFPMTHYIRQLRNEHTYHWENGNTATCWFWVKGTQAGFWAHRAYLATQSLHFRTIFDRFTANPAEELELEVPHPDVLWGILKYLYDGDVEAWLKNWFTSQEMVRKIRDLVKYLEIVEVPEKVSYRVRLELEAVRLT